MTEKTLTVEQLAAALNELGAGNIELMAWSPFRYDADGGTVFENEEANVVADDEYPMASLAAGIWKRIPG